MIFITCNKSFQLKSMVEEFFSRKERELCKYGGRTVREDNTTIDTWAGYYWSISTIDPYLQVHRDVVSESTTLMLPITEVDLYLHGALERGYVLGKKDLWESIPSVLDNMVFRNFVAIIVNLSKASKCLS